MESPPVFLLTIQVNLCALLTDLKMPTLHDLVMPLNMIILILAIYLFSKQRLSPIILCRTN